MSRQQNIEDPIDLVILATNKYNNTFHSVTNCKHIDALHTSSSEGIDQIKNKLSAEQARMLKWFNKHAILKKYVPGEKVFLRRNKRLDNKFEKVFIEKIIQKDLGTTVLIDGKHIHKSNLR